MEGRFRPRANRLDQRFSSLRRAGSRRRGLDPAAFRAAMLLHASWEDVVFLHFIVEAPPLRKRLPEPLRLDLPLGEAWLTVVGMRCRGPAPLPSRLLRGLPAFAQVQLRTYVRADGGEPALFLLEQAVSSGAMAAAARLFGLKQHGAPVRVSRDADTLRLSLGEPDAASPSPPPADRGPPTGPRLAARVHVAGPTLRAMNDPIGRALLERYALFDGTPPRKTRVEHAPWVIQPLAVEALDSAGLLPEGARLAAAQLGTPRVVALGIPHGLAAAEPTPLIEPA